MQFMQQQMQSGLSRMLRTIMHATADRIWVVTDLEDIQACRAFLPGSVGRMPPSSNTAAMNWESAQHTSLHWYAAQDSTAQRSTAQHSTAQHSTAQIAILHKLFRLFRGAKHLHWKKGAVKSGLRGCEAYIWCHKQCSAGLQQAAS